MHGEKIKVILEHLMFHSADLTIKPSKSNHTSFGGNFTAGTLLST